MNVAVIGLGKLGAPLAAVLADAGHRVYGVDKSAAYVDAINAGIAPVDEPGLQELLDRLPSGKLSATTSYDAIRIADVSMIVVPTPSGADGRFSNEYVLEAVREIGKNIGPVWHTVVVCSTVMPGSMDKEIIPALQKAADRRLGNGLGACYSPEFIALGSVIKDMRNPDAVFIGSNDPASVNVLRTLIATYVETNPEVHTMTFAEAELAKIAVNAFVTMKISYANMIGEFCEKIKGAQASSVLAAVGADSRIGKSYLRAGASYGGPCFPRDNRAMVALAWELKCRAELPYATDRTNLHVTERLAADLSKFDVIAILGLSYKPGTSVVEESMGLSIATSLAAIGKEVRVHDPVAKPTLPENVRQYDTIEETIDNASVVMVCTPWDAYSDFDFGSRKILDAWNVTMHQSNRRVVGNHSWWTW